MNYQQLILPKFCGGKKKSKQKTHNLPTSSFHTDARNALKNYVPAINAQTKSKLSCSASQSFIILVHLFRN